MLRIEAMTRSARYPSLLNRHAREQCEEVDSYAPTNEYSSRDPKSNPVSSDGSKDADVEQQNGHLNQRKPCVVHEILHEEDQRHL